MMITIYKIQNKITNECYIGQTKKILKQRIQGGKNYRSCSKMKKAIDDYGWENFSFCVLEEIEVQEKADLLEEFYIRKYNSIENGYNLQSGGLKNYVSNTSTKEKLSKIAKDKDYEAKIESYRYRKGNEPKNKGKHLSLETRKKLSISLKGKHNSKKTEFTSERCCGSNNYRAYGIYQYDFQGNFIKYYETAKQASEETGINRGTICCCRKGTRKSAGGFIWLSNPLAEPKQKY